MKEKRRNFREQYREVVSAGHLPRSIHLGNNIRFRADKTPLRYGLSPGDPARAYRQDGYSGPSVLGADIIRQGKIRSYSNIEDWDTGLSIISYLNLAFPDEECVCVMKHGIPFAVGKASSVEEAYVLAWNRDPIIPFGSVITLSGVVEKPLAERINQVFIDGILAKGYTDGAIDVLKKKPDLRIIQLPNLRNPIDDYGYEVKSVQGGMLLADRHKLRTLRPEDIGVQSVRQPDEYILRTAVFQWIVNTHVRSNAATFGDSNVTYGVGAGQGSRVDALRVALTISRDRCPYYTRWRKNKDRELVLATDGFPPETDSIEICHEHGIAALMSPKGSLKDQVILDRANELGLLILYPESNERPFTHR